ncbi:uncharacterized protein LOC143528228 [Brachyhypopomus gauderio]|uniref:uncharacterized protein LOC143528228 n=1 Tax=Brachyhypopomus gauderio TaxID=698409 RepID=UPI004042540A
MASECSTVQYTSEDEEFHHTLTHVGGPGQMYLVGDVNEMDNKCDYSILHEFTAEIFHSDRGDLSCALTHIRNGDIRSGSCQDIVSDINMQSDEPCVQPARSTLKDQDQYSSEPGVPPLKKEGDSSDKRARVKSRIVKTNANMSAKGRTISCAIIIFIFRHVYVHNKNNRVCVEEVLKDVKARTKRSGLRPALLGLIYSDVESAETRGSVMFLEQTLRSVFTKHPHESIWAGHYISKSPDGMQTIKRHICTTVHFSQSPDNMPEKQGCLSLPLRWFRGEGQPSSTSNSPVQKGNPENTEEGIPLRMRSIQHS